MPSSLSDEQAGIRPLKNKRMKIKRIVAGMLALLVAALISMSYMNPQQEQSFEKQWNEVEKLMKVGKTRSALEIVENIYEKARQEGNNPQYLKAVLYRIKLTSDFKEDFMITLINDLEVEVKTSSQPEKEVLHSIAAEMYWRYYQANRHKILNRTINFESHSKDLESWDARQLVNTVTSHYKASIKGGEATKKIQLEKYAPILEEKPGSKKYRPTLFDFLAQRAVAFFMREEPGITRPAAHFKMNDIAHLADAEQFATLPIKTIDTASLDYLALKTLQKLTKFHIDDDNPAPLIDVDLTRLEYVHSKSICSKKDSLYLNALETLKKRNPDHPVTARIFFQIANYLNKQGNTYHPHQRPENQWNKKKAIEICHNAIENYPDSEGAHNCSILADNIMATDLRFETEYVHPPDKPFRALVTYKNIDRIYGRAININPDEYKKIQQNNHGKEVIRQLIKLPITGEWKQNLDNQGDFQHHSLEMALPELEKGFYVILLSDNENFDLQQAHIAEASFWTSNISYIHQSHNDGSKQFYVLNHNTGNPLEKAEVQVFYRDYDHRNRRYITKKGKRFETNEKGFFSIKKADVSTRSYSLGFYHNDDTLISKSYFRSYSRSSKSKKQTRTHLFTDRAIYRPGQPIHFKGIMLERQGKEHTILPHQKTTITLFDVNGQKVHSIDLKTNEYGSFSGSFTAPVGRLTGQMRIADAHGRVYISVEEYKRPNFEVNFKPITGSYKLNETLELTGKAMGYSGNPIIDAHVNYRVVRSVRFPFFFFSWFNMYPSSPELEIAQGVTSTNESGEFSISFTAIPDLQVPKSTNPVFDYRVEADVTDIAGETHSQKTTVSVGYQSLEFELGINGQVNRQEQDSLTLEITNLNGEPQEASGTLTIFRLQQPNRLIRERKWQRPDQFVMNERKYVRLFPNDEYNNEADFRYWTKEKAVLERAFTLPGDSVFEFQDIKSWEQGKYSIMINTTDSFGEDVEYVSYFTLFDPKAKKSPLNSYSWFNLSNNKVHPGDSVNLLVGSHAKNVRMIFEIEHDGKIIGREWYTLNDEQKNIVVPITEDYRGNVGINVAFVKHGRAYTYNQVIQVPHSDKKLDIEFATFRNELKPGAEEEWQITIKDHLGERVASELLTAMYDASLDIFRENHWSFNVLNSYYPNIHWQSKGVFDVTTAHSVTGKRTYYAGYEFPLYDRLNWFGFNYYGGGPYLKFNQGEIRGRQAMQGVPESKTTSLDIVEDDTDVPSAKGELQKKEEKSETVSKQPPVRKNFNETAFFFPHLQTDTSGNIVLKFTMPDALTRWNFMGLAHTKDLKFASFRKELITQKELMVIPNAPRFIRQGDTIWFTSKIVNMSDKAISGTIKLELFDAVSMQAVDSIYANESPKTTFEIDKAGSAIAQWKLIIPNTHYGALTYRISANAGAYTDIMENTLPVMTNRMLVTETMPLAVDGEGNFDFTFTGLLQSKQSVSLKNHRLTLEFTANPAWYAVQSLPYMMERDAKNALSIFHRLYANMLASHIVNANPKIKRVFESWKQYSPEAFMSNLEKNEDLKNVLLQETPWVMEAKNESEQKRRVALLFDLNKMAQEKEAALQQLANLQSPNGGWPWFEGMPDSRYITQQIVSGFGHLDQLGINRIYEGKNWQMVKKAVQYLDERLREDYDRLENKDKKASIGRSKIQYLYARSYFASTIEMNYHEAFNFYKNNTWDVWTDQNEYMQGMIALAMHRYGEKEKAAAIIASLKERALHKKEMGMYWRNINESGYYWHEAGIESQALLIEAFDEITGDREAVKEMKKWLLKQKQTQRWKTTKATAEAVYALLLHGADWLSETPKLTVKLGEETINPQTDPDIKTQAGTGYFKTSWEGTSIEPGMGEISVTKNGKGIAWGAAYWQYFEELDKIERHETPMQLTKNLFIERNTASGPVVHPLNPDHTLHVGDKIIVRMKIVSDRNMEYVHLKDMRASAFEPVKTISGSGYKDGLYFYRSTRDIATHFYFNRLPRGTYVFEYPLRISQQGQFSNGIATIQCMYAPEFSAHSNGIRVTVLE